MDLIALADENAVVLLQIARRGRLAMLGQIGRRGADQAPVVGDLAGSEVEVR
jgi:hypothetical protein